MDDINLAEIGVKFVIYLVGGIVSGFFILFGWVCKETFRNSKDVNALHSSKRSNEGRIDRIEKFINGRLRDGQAHTNFEDILDRDDNSPGSIVPGGSDLDFE